MSVSLLFDKKSKAYSRWFRKTIHLITQNFERQCFLLQIITVQAKKKRKKKEKKV